jgi:peptidyl-prolyl cis-trans isomerase D
MAAIGQIRKHYGILVAIIAIALAAFILGDFAKSGPRTPNNIGVVEGEEISYKNFSIQVEKTLEAQKQNSGKNQVEVEEAFNIKLSVWNQMVRKIIMDKQIAEIGLTVTAPELFDQVQGLTPHRYILQYFTDPATGGYNQALVLNYLQNLDKMPRENQVQWFEFEKAIKEDYFNVKYNTLVAKAYHLPKAFAKKLDEMAVAQANVDFVAYPYSAISNETVAVNDNDFEAYYKKNKEDFKQDETRNVQYVVFNVKPSEEDRKEQSARFEESFQEFRGLDIADAAKFAHSNSDVKHEDKWYAQGELPVQIDLAMFEGEIGAIVSPYMYNNSFYAARLLQTQMRPKEMKASHVLISYVGALRAAPEVKRTKTQASALADSLFQLVRKNKTQLEELAVKFSNDGGVVENKGHYDWFPDGQMVPEFNEAVVNGKIGEIVLVETAFGFHVITIDDKRDLVKKVKVALLERNIEPSNQTYQDIYNSASEFASKASSLANFTSAAEAMKLTVRVGDHISPMAVSIPGLDDSRQTIIWAFNTKTKVEDVNLFDQGDTYIVAVLSKINEEGYQSLAEAKPGITEAVKNLKKAETMVTKLNASAGKGNLNSLASEFNLKVENVSNLTFDSRGFGVYGPEPLVVGTVFAQKEGSISTPLIGKKAVYVLNLRSLKAAQAKTDYAAMIQQMETRFSAQVNYSLYKSLEENAKIEDNRYRFF